MPESRTFSARPGRITEIVSPSAIPITLPENDSARTAEGRRERIVKKMVKYLVTTAHGVQDLD